MMDLTHTFRALRYRNFRLFFIGQGLSVMGTWLQQVAMGWLTYRLSGSVWLLGVVAFCGSAGILALRHVRRCRRRSRPPPARVAVHAVARAAAGRRARRAHVVRAHRRLAPDRALAVARTRLRVRHSAAPVAVGAPGRGSRRPAERDRAQLVPGQRRAGRRPGGRRAAARRRQRSGVLRAQRAVVRRGDRRDRPHALGARAPAAPWSGGFWASWVEGYRFAAGFAPARAMLAARRGAGVDDQPVFVADAGLREGHLRRRARRRWASCSSAAGAGALISTLYLASRIDDSRAGPRDRDRRAGLRPRARGIRLPYVSSRSRCC